MTNTTKRIVLGLGACALAVGVTAGVYAAAQNTNPPPPPFSGQRMGRGGPMGPGGLMGPGGPLGMLRMFGERLGLTDAQKDQLKAIAESHRDEWKALADRARTAHDALHDAIMADTIDDALIRAKSADVAAVDADMAVAAAHARAEAWQVLTPDQRAQVKQFQANAKSRMNNRRGAIREHLEQLFH